MPQGDEEAGAVEEALKDGEGAIVADLDASKVLQAGIGALDFPSSFVAAQFAFVLKAAVADVFAIGHDQLGSTRLAAQPERIRIITAISNHTAQVGAWAATAPTRHLHPLEGTF